MKVKPDLSFWKLWNLSFGFFGVQIAYALQSANISRIFRTLGADPHSLSFFWILPPLMGILVQPIVGTLSDKTWCRWGRRIPYLFIGAAVAVAVMCLLPNSGSLGLSISAVMIFGLLMLMLLDTSINMAMQPFKMLVGDMVNEKQKAKIPLPVRVHMARTEERGTRRCRTRFCHLVVLHWCCHPHSLCDLYHDESEGVATAGICHV